MSQEIKILGKEIKPGSSHKLSIDIAKLYTNTQIEVPVLIERGKKDGPCVLITAGIHGDEVNGVEIVRQIVQMKINKPTSGMVICMPLINVFGFLNETREFPDGRDLNRVFPGSKLGSLASRFAYHLMEKILPHVDYVLDFHTGGGQRFNITQLRVNSDEKTLELAKKLNVPFILYSNFRSDTFREACIKKGKTAILFEGGKAMFLDKIVTKKGVECAQNLLQVLGLRKGEMLTPEEPKLISKSKWVRATKSGMFRSTVKNGVLVNKGDIMGTISDPFGQFQHQIKCPLKGYLICINHSPLVNQGDAIFNIGIE